MKKDARVTFNCDGDMKKMLIEIAKKAKCSVSELLISIIVNGCDWERQIRDERRALTDRYISTTGWIKKADGTIINIE
jgi:hypothetical protein